MRLSDRLKSVAGSPLLLDGGVGTGLLARGLDVNREPPEAWLITQPETVADLHRGFVAAGSEAIQTNSFGLLRLLLSDKLPAPAKVLVERSVALCAQAIASVQPARSVYIVASLGPAWQRPDPLDPTRQALTRAAADLAAHFAEAGVSAIHLETQCDPDELFATLRGVREGAPGLPLFCSVTLSLGPVGLVTPLGTPLSRMLRELERHPPEAIGVNCALPARKLRRAVQELRAFTADGLGLPALPVLAKPEVSAPELATRASPDCRTPPVAESPERFARDLVTLWEEDGATILGGCCGTTAAHLASLSALVTQKTRS